MATQGRPTPQPGDQFHDRTLDEFGNSVVNPYLVSHREFGPPLYPADALNEFNGDWAALFGREAPLHLEIGSGNGFFLRGIASQHPDWNVLGIELRYKRTVLCAKKIRDAGLKNAAIARYHAGYLRNLIAPGSLDGVYVNHPDPWPKERHEKHRLISRWFLEDVANWLKPGARFQLKSDFAPNVERVEGLLSAGPEGEPLSTLPLEITGTSDDVNGVGAPWKNDIVTNYQIKMQKRGMKVYAIELVRR